MIVSYTYRTEDYRFTTRNAIAGVVGRMPDKIEKPRKDWRKRRRVQELVWLMADDEAEEAARKIESRFRDDRPEFKVEVRV